MAEKEPDRRVIDEQRKIFDAITKDWLDEKFAAFGRWTFKAILAIVFITLLRAVFHLNSADLRMLLDTAGQAAK
jgi:hypothetical protein